MESRLRATAFVLAVIIIAGAVMISVPAVEAAPPSAEPAGELLEAVYDNPSVGSADSSLYTREPMRGDGGRQSFSGLCRQLPDAREPLEAAEEVGPVEVEPETIEESEPELLGTFTIYAYCPCAKCCGKSDGITATGTLATEGRTIAVDPDVISLGSTVVIEGHEYIAEDTGGGIKGKTIDMYMDSHEAALQWGVRKLEVWR